MAPVLLGVVTACTPATDEEPQTGTTAQTMYACGSVQPDITSNATSGLDATVGRLLHPDHSCSAVALTRNSAVTARHCFRGADNIADWTFNMPQAGGYSQPLTAILHHPWAWDILQHDCAGEGGIETAISDVAVVWFGPDPIPPSVMAAPAKVSVSSSIYGVVDFLYEFHIAGFGDWLANINDGERRRGKVGGLEFESDGSCIPGWGLQAEACYLGNGVVAADGDSGGGLFVVSMLPPYEAKLVGINSGGESDPLGTWKVWASTSIRKVYQEGYGGCMGWPDADGCEFTSNASLIMQALGVDADEDDVPDDVDNCPPWVCVNQLGWPLEACFNPDGADSDGDGHGDVCDLCPFDSMPWPFDTDGDGRPDTCDNCPHDPLPSEDDDGDGVGNRCDCPGTNNSPYQPCASAADCVGAGHCVVSQYGNHCSLLLDTDGDGAFDDCDVCPGNPNNVQYGISASSNIDAEQKWASNFPPVPDPCDEVPQMTMRPIALLYEDKDEFCWVDALTLEPCINNARFAATAAVGSADDTTKTFEPAPVGFRHCDCYDNGNALEREQCLASKCELILGDYSALVKYDAVTVTAGGSTIYPSSPAAPYFDRTFSSAVSKDTSLHPSDHIDGSDWENEIWRVGTAETISWRVKQDITAGHVTGHGPDGDQTTGLFWSIVLPTDLAASARDHFTYQRLRSTYAYLTTPVLAPPFSPADYPDFAFDCKLCSILLPAEHALINPFEQDYHWPYPAPVRIVSVGEQLILSAGGALPAYDASPYLSPALQRLLLDGQSAWLAPVESGVEARRLRPGAHLVAIPESWDGSARVLEIVEQGGLLQLAGEIIGPEPRSPAEALDAAILAQAEPAADPALGEVRVPGPRSGARALLSLRAGGLLLVGGQTGTLPSSGEIWRYHLDSRVWSETIYDPPKIETLKALAYDGARQWLLVLDEVDEPLFVQGSVDGSGGGGKVLVCHDPPGKGEPRTIEIAAAAVPAHLGHGDSEGPCAHDAVRTVTRLIAVSLANGRAWVLGSWIHPRLAGLPLRRYQRLALGAVREGAFLLLGSRADTDAIDVFGLELAPSGEPSWTGLTTVPGTLLEEPVRAVDGLVAAVWRDGGERLVTFTEAELTPSAAAPQGF